MQPADTTFFIYGEPANINYFVNTDLTPISEEGTENKQVSVKAHTRRRYVGDENPINVSSASRTFLVDPGRKIGNALPGSPFILDDGTEKRQFTLQGDIIDLHAWLVGEASMDLKLYTNTGTRYTIAAAEGGG